MVTRCGSRYTYLSSDDFVDSLESRGGPRGPAAAWRGVGHGGIVCCCCVLILLLLVLMMCGRDGMLVCKHAGVGWISGLKREVGVVEVIFRYCPLLFGTRHDGCHGARMVRSKALLAMCERARDTTDELGWLVDDECKGRRGARDGWMCKWRWGGWRCDERIEWALYG